jgi:hypothetical protein
VVLGGGGGGVRISGRIAANTPATIVDRSPIPPARPERGGEIVVTGAGITLAGAVLDASGIDGGGSIRIGGDQGGAGPLPNADRTTIDADSHLLADALGQGDGGRVIVWSEDHTVFNGQISARGGDLGGNGGFAEVSGRANLTFTGLADLRAPLGDWGTLLLDPSDFVVVASADYDPYDFNQIDVAVLESQLALGNVTLDTSSGSGSDVGNITIDTALGWTSGTTLTLLADNAISIDGAINALGDLVLSALTLSASADISVEGFTLQSGAWVQLGVLPAFTATDFQLYGGGATFLRATGGSGTVADPWILTDIYGVQGVGTYLDGNFALGSNIDASSTPAWNADYGFDPIGDAPGEGAVPFTGTFDGRGFVIDGLSSSFYEAAMFGGTDGATIRNLVLTNVNMSGVYLTAGLIADAFDTVIASVQVGGALVGNDSEYTGGLVARMSGGSVTDAQVSADISISSFSDFQQVFRVGGLIGEADGVAIARSIVSGAIDVTIGFAGSGTQGLLIGGLVGNLAGSSTVADSRSSADITVRGSGEGSWSIGGLIGAIGSGSSVLASIASGNIVADVTDGALIGGLAGGNAGSIVQALALGDLIVTGDFFGYIGGLLGINSGNVDQTAALNDLIIDFASASGYVGGHSGASFGTITRSYTWGDLSVSGTDPGRLSLPYAIGGFVGLAGGTIDQTYSARSLSVTLAPNLSFGGFAGENSAATIGASFWDTDVAGTTVGTDGIGLTTAQFQDTAYFRALAESLGWSFTADWSPTDLNFYPELYTIAPVIWAQPDDATFVYGTAPVLGGNVYGGPGVYVFDQPGDTLDTSGIFVASYGRGDVGLYPIRPSVPSLISSGGLSFRVAQGLASLSITPASLLISALDQIKIYGELLDLGADGFTVVGLQYGDTVDAVTLTSPGAAADASVAGGPYVIDISDAIGSGLIGANGANYIISYVSGALTVTPAALTITILDLAKVYGVALALGTDGFIASGLLNSDSVDAVTLASAGAVASADVGGGPYAITGSGAVGTGLGNYVISYVSGALTVTPAALVITALDRIRRVGEAIDLTGGYTVAGLVNGDSVLSVLLQSLGTDPGALPGDYPILASGAAGNGVIGTGGVANYAISYVAGQLTVEPGAPTEPIPYVPVPGGGPPNPPDLLQIGLGASPSDAPSGGVAAGAPQAVATAQQTLAEIITVSNDLQQDVASCNQSNKQAEDFLACLSDALDKYSSALDSATLDLPPSLQNVSAIIQTARQGVDAARDRALSRLARATTDAERQAIRRDAVDEARQSLQTAQTEIERSIALIRADDPDLARVQVEQGNVVLAAVKKVDLGLERAVGL